MPETVEDVRAKMQRGQRWVDAEVGRSMGYFLAAEGRFNADPYHFAYPDIETLASNLYDEANRA